MASPKILDTGLAARSQVHDANRRARDKKNECIDLETRMNSLAPDGSRQSDIWVPVSEFQLSWDGGRVFFVFSRSRACSEPEDACSVIIKRRGFQVFLAAEARGNAGRNRAFCCSRGNLQQIIYAQATSARPHVIVRDQGSGVVVKTFVQSMSREYEKKFKVSTIEVHQPSGVMR